MFCFFSSPSPSFVRVGGTRYTSNHNSHTTSRTMIFEESIQNVTQWKQSRHSWNNRSAMLWFRDIFLGRSQTATPPNLAGLGIPKTGRGKGAQSWSSKEKRRGRIVRVWRPGRRLWWQEGQRGSRIRVSIGGTCKYFTWCTHEQPQPF